MSSYGTDRRPLNPSDPNARKPAGGTPGRGNLHSEIDQMLSALPEVPDDLPDSATDETVADDATPADLNSTFSQMLTSLPDGPEPDADFDLRSDVPTESPAVPDPRAGAGRRSGSPGYAVNSAPVGFGSVQNAPSQSRPVQNNPPRPPAPRTMTERPITERPAAERPAAARPAPSRPEQPRPEQPRPGARSTPRYPTDPVDEPQAPPRSRSRGRSDDAPTKRFGRSEDEIADFLSSDEEITPPATSGGAGRSGGSRAPVARSFGGRGASESTSSEGAPLAQRILDELEKYSISSVAQLRIAVHDGAVTIMGTVPTDYEKKLIVHFAKQVPGVSDVVDMMQIVGGAGLSSGPEIPGAAPALPAAPRKKPRRPRGPGLQLSFPFQAKHVGIAVGILAMVYAGYTFATRDGTKLSLNTLSTKVLLDGVPAEGATVTLHPLDESVPVSPKGTVKPDGSVQFWTYLPGDGVPEGDYKLTVVWKKLEEINGDLIAGPNLMPDELSRPESSTVEVSVQSGKNEMAPLNLTK